MAVAAMLLAGCAAGTPGVVKDVEPTEEVAQIPAAQEVEPGAPIEPSITATETPEPTFTPEPEPTDTPRPKPTRTPEPGPTERPTAPQRGDSGFSRIFQRGESGRPEIALTFDAGADRGHAETILDTLDAYGVKASFGITGSWAEENPDLVARMVDEGHMVFNHSWSHRSFTGYSTAGWDAGVLTYDERAAELHDTESVIADVADGYETAPYFRPPYGDLDDDVLAVLAAEGYWITVMWSCDSLGWNGASVDQIVERCAAGASAGDIILLHVGGESLDSAALPRMIETYLADGFELVTIEALLQP